MVGGGPTRAIEITSMMAAVHVAFASLLAIGPAVLPETGRRELEEIERDR